MKKIISVLMILCILSPFVLAEELTDIDIYHYSDKTIPEERRLPRLVDDAELLGEAEESALLALLDKISENNSCDVAIATVEGIGEYSEILEFADDYYDYNGFGIGSGDDGMVLVVDMNGRNVGISTHGFAIDAINPSAENYLYDSFLDYLSTAAYYDAFTAYANCCDELLDMARDGEPYGYSAPVYGGDYYYGDDYYYDDEYYYEDDAEMSIGGTVAVSVIVGVIIAFIALAVMSSKMKTVRSQSAAGSYVRSGSFNVTESSESFLYRRVNKTPRPQNNSGGRGGSSFGGGRSGGVRISSSGRSHGGSSRRF